MEALAVWIFNYALWVPIKLSSVLPPTIKIHGPTLMKNGMKFQYLEHWHIIVVQAEMACLVELSKQQILEEIFFPIHCLF